jgi:hypothetical protein
LAGVGVAPDVFLVAICGAITYFGLTYGNLLWGALMQLAVPAQMLGRASSVDWLFSICMSPLGLVFAGALASTIGVRETVLAGAGLAALSCLVIFMPGVRDPERADYAPMPLPSGVIGGEASPPAPNAEVSQPADRGAPAGRLVTPRPAGG